MKDAIADVTAFHLAMDVPVAARPVVPSPERTNLRISLLREEQWELFEAIRKENLVEIADGCADLIYVVIGTALEYGIPLAAVWDAVQASNMAKIDPATGKVRKRADGKVLKPEGWMPPDIESIITAAK